MPRTSPLLAVLAALLLAGCTPGVDQPDFSGAEEAVAEAVSDLQSAARTTEGAEEICAQALTPALAERLAEGSSCRQEIAYAISDADLVALTVTDVQVQGDTATAVAESAAGDTEVTGTFELERVEGAWRIAGLSLQGQPAAGARRD